MCRLTRQMFWYIALENIPTHKQEISFFAGNIPFLSISHFWFVQFLIVKPLNVCKDKTHIFYVSKSWILQMASKEKHFSHKMSSFLDMSFITYVTFFCVLLNSMCMICNCTTSKCLSWQEATFDIQQTQIMHKLGKKTEFFGYCPCYIHHFLAILCQYLAYFFLTFSCDTSKCWYW